MNDPFLVTTVEGKEKKAKMTQAVSLRHLQTSSFPCPIFKLVIRQQDPWINQREAPFYLILCFLIAAGAYV